MLRSGPPRRRSGGWPGAGYEHARSDLPRIRLHDLRHTCAVRALQADVHPRAVQERLGHSNISITLDTCSHVLPAVQTDAAAQVAALIFGSPTT